MADINVEQVLKKLTTKEKVALTAGMLFQTVFIIPRHKLTISARN